MGRRKMEARSRQGNGERGREGGRREGEFGDVDGKREASVRALRRDENSDTGIPAGIAETPSEASRITMSVAGHSQQGSAGEG
eukprot:1364457-Amorphochlora_amoeboformis.AAC.1